jgi:hypothetical protein
MSRSIVRSLVVGLALVAAPAVVEAQTCTDTSSTGGATCTVNATATLTIPQIVNISIPSATIALTQPTWATFLAGGPTQYTQTVVSVTSRANTDYDLEVFSTGDWTTEPVGGDRTLADITYTVGATCAAPGTLFTGSGVVFLDDQGPGTTATNLCLTTRFVTDLADPIMAAGAWVFDVRLTIVAP